jgi:hypothetical protein
VKRYVLMHHRHGHSSHIHTWEAEAKKKGEGGAVVVEERKMGLTCAGACAELGVSVLDDHVGVLA